MAFRNPDVEQLLDLILKEAENHARSRDCSWRKAGFREWLRAFVLRFKRRKNDSDSFFQRTGIRRGDFSGFLKESINTARHPGFGKGIPMRFISSSRVAFVR